MRRLGLVLILPLLLLGVAFVWLRYMACIVFAPGKAWRIALMLDQTINVGANGQVNTTISGRAGRARAVGRRWGCILCRALDWIDRGHCTKAVEDEA